MEHGRRIDQDIARIEERIARALEALEDFFQAVQEHRGFADQLRSRAAAAREALAEARGVVPQMAEDWRHLHDRIVELRRELDRLEGLVGELTRSLEEQVWPAS